MEHIQGIKVSDLAGLEAAGQDRKLLAARGAEIILEQVLRFGFFHADPHPGNVFILPGNLICYLDFGMMGSVDRQAREDFADLIFAYLGRDEKKVAQVLLRVMEYDEEPNRRALEKDLADFLEGALYPPLKKAPIASLLKVLLELIHRHRLRIPADIFWCDVAQGQNARNPSVCNTCLGPPVSAFPDWHSGHAPFSFRIRCEDSASALN